MTVELFHERLDVYECLCVFLVFQADQPVAQSSACTKRALTSMEAFGTRSSEVGRMHVRSHSEVACMDTAICLQIDYVCPLPPPERMIWPYYHQRDCTLNLYKLHVKIFSVKIKRRGVFIFLGLEQRSVLSLIGFQLLQSYRVTFLVFLESPQTQRGLLYVMTLADC